MAETPDLSLLTNAFVEFGGKIFRKRINKLDLSNQGIIVYKNVKAPIALPMLTTTGSPRPYRAQDDTTTPVAIADRILTVHQSKWDFDVDPEKWRNTYLARYKAGDQAFADFIINAVSEKYLSEINDKTLFPGVYNAAGTTAADLATGWGVIIAAEIVAGTLVPVVTGAITAANAVAKVSLVASSVPVWMREEGFRVYCSYAVFDLYATNYAAVFGYQFEADATNRYRINNTLGYLFPVSWMGISQRLIASVDDNLAVGTDGDNVQVAASMRRNIIEVREMMPIGLQITDLAAMVVNDQA